MDKRPAPLPLRSLHRALADPLRVRLLELVSGRAQSAKELAAAVRLPADRLYHHLGQLVDAGLLTIAEYRALPGGKVERIYGPARTEPPGDDATPEETARFVGAMLEATRVEVDAACEARAGGARRKIAVTRATVRLSTDGLAALQAALAQALAEASGRRDEGPYVRVAWALVDLQDR